MNHCGRPATSVAIRRLLERMVAANPLVGDFFTVEVLNWGGLVTYYVLFVLHLENRRMHIAGITRHPDHDWMEQIGR